MKTGLIGAISTKNIIMDSPDMIIANQHQIQKDIMKCIEVQHLTEQGEYTAVIKNKRMTA